MKPSNLFSYFKERPKRTFGAAVLLLASLYAGVKGCPDSQSPSSPEKNNPEQVDGFRRKLGIVARAIISSLDKQEEDPNPPAEEAHFYQIDPEDPSFYLNTAVECLTDSEEFICPRNHSLFGDTTYYCLPTGESEEFHVPFTLSNVTGYPGWCYTVDPENIEEVAESGCTSYRAAKIGMNPGKEISFDPENFDREDFCEDILGKAKVLEKDDHCNWAYSNGEVYGEECDRRWDRNLDFAFNSDVIEDMQDAVWGKLEDVNMDFEFLPTGEFVLEEGMSISVVAIGPETPMAMFVEPDGEVIHEARSSEPFYFKVLDNHDGESFTIFDESNLLESITNLKEEIDE